MVTDEAASFFQEIKGQDTKHESNIGLMNQLFDGKGDKTSLAKLRNRFVPPNSTSLCLGVQPHPFFRALTSIGKTIWADSGFSERFLFTTIKPFRVKYLLCHKYSGHTFIKNVPLSDA